MLGEVAGEDGDAAVVEIVRFPETGDDNPEGKLIALLGAPGGLDVETRKVLLREGIEETVSEAVQVEVERVAASIDPSHADGREDIRELDLVTIDPKDARDRDDAIPSCARWSMGKVDCVWRCRCTSTTAVVARARVCVRLSCVRKRPSAMSRWQLG